MLFLANAGCGEVGREGHFRNGWSKILIKKSAEKARTKSSRIGAKIQNWRQHLALKKAVAISRDLTEFVTRSSTLIELSGTSSLIITSILAGMSYWLVQQLICRLFAYNALYIICFIFV